MSETTGRSQAHLRKVLNELAIAGLVTRPKRGWYALTDAGHVRMKFDPKAPVKPRQIRKPKPGSVRSRVWRAIQIKQEFTIGDLLPVVENNSGGTYATIGAFCVQLEKCGYLRGVFLAGDHEALNNATRIKKYRVAKHTGPVAPVWVEAENCLHDHNTGEKVYA
ncbi:hypothetical protein [uncultured Tateyamaria sp.]|uniref:hypothetical protein n=1 Tax=uncultured Tateyamaria sp. TaxID=455651 RepID=UPI0026112335|nr:hypothetical protein [uncultured Tateyamaria sp.]